MTEEAKKLHKVQLEKEKETLLITLYAKARDNRLKHSILRDAKAEEMVERIDYDFAKFNRSGNDNLIVVRAKQLDTWVKEFLGIHPDAVVLNLGCGLDTRISRINPPVTARWFDVDYPDVIEVRELFYANRNGYEMIATSVTEPGWLENLPRNKPTMIIAEGLLEYLKEDEVAALLNRITDHFRTGQIAFDVMNSFAIQAGKASLKESTGAEHKWAVDDSQKVDQLNAQMQKIADISVLESDYIRNLSLKYRLMYALMRTAPQFRNMIRLLFYKF